MHKSILMAFSLVLMLGFVQIRSSENTHREDALPISPIPNTETMVMHSAAINQDYVVLVALPYDYAFSDESYPVLYLLDPHVSFGTAAEQLRLLAWSEELPEMIIVSIGYPAYLEWGSSGPLGKINHTSSALNAVTRPRARDFISGSGGREQFLEFLTESIIPQIDSTYRTDPTDRALFGHSQGGAFVLYALEAATEAFNRYIAASPTGFCGNCKIPTSAERTVRLFLSAGEFEGSILWHTQHIFSTLIEASYPGLEVSMQIFEGETHQSVLPFALIKGTRAVFCEPDTVPECIPS